MTQFGDTSGVTPRETALTMRHRRPLKPQRRPVQLSSPPDVGDTQMVSVSSLFAFGTSPLMPGRRIRTKEKVTARTR